MKKASRNARGFFGKHRGTGFAGPQVVCSVPQFAGTLPPLAASLVMTWRCSQMFILALSLVSAP